MDEQPRLYPVNHALVLGPYPRLQVHVQFIFLRRFLPQPVEIEFRVRRTGSCGSGESGHPPPIRRMELDVFEAVALDPERDSDEAATPGPALAPDFPANSTSIVPL